MIRGRAALDVWLAATLLVLLVKAAPIAASDGAAAAGQPAPPGNAAPVRTVVARLVVLNQPYMQNRLGAAQTNGRYATVPG